MRSEGKEDLAWIVDDIGGRPDFEDDHVLVTGTFNDSESVLAAVFDGHGGREVAHLAASRFPSLLRRSLDTGMTTEQAVSASFHQIDREAAKMQSGAVAVAFLMRGGEVVFGNVGDAELLLVSRALHETLTQNHRLANHSERVRILAAGGRINGPYVTLKDGRGLQCTRSLGDGDFKAAGVTAEPFVGTHALGREDVWLVAACDGLWDVMRYDEVAAIARKMRTPKAVAEALHHEAVVVRETPDNLTVIAVRAIYHEPAGKA